PHQINASGIYHTIYKFVMKVALYFKYKTISKYVKKGTLLDVGGGGGEFCNYFKSFGWNVTMLETSKPARDNAIALGINTVSGFSEIEPDQRFDLITLWHSLEHIHDLDELFNNIKKYLKPDGYVIFAVPNILANERKYYPDSWAAYDAPRHLYHFSPSSLKAILQKYQIQIIQSFPLFQDTPYNILHSMPEKNIAQALKAIFICCETLLKIFFKGNHFASSLEVICNLKSS
ncbi:MAG: class I SAM-dependent methyltransferase, partial [Fidelibacterota bacterium]